MITIPLYLHYVLVNNFLFFLAAILKKDSGKGSKREDNKSRNASACKRTRLAY